MSTSSVPQSSSSSETAWWTPSSWVPDATQDSASTASTSYPDWSSQSDSSTLSLWTWTWMETNLPTAARVTGAGPPSTSSFTLSSLSSSPTLLTVISSSTSPSRLIATQTSQIGSTGQNLKGTTVKFKTGHIVAVSIVTFVVLSAMASLFIYLLIRLRVRKLGHQRLYSCPDENFDDDPSTMAFLKRARNGGGEALDFSAAVGMRCRTGNISENTPAQVLGRSYHKEWRSLPDGEASPILQPSLSQSDSPASAISPELETSSMGFNVHESPTVQSSSVLFLEEAHEPLSPSDPPRYSQILPMKPTIRPLPVPRNPRPLIPQRRVDSVQVRKQNKPPLISSSTTSLPLPSSPPTLSPAPSPASVRNTAQGLCAVPVSEKVPLLPQRRTDSTPSWSLSNPTLTPLAPLRPTLW